MLLLLLGCAGSASESGQPGLDPVLVEARSPQHAQRELPGRAVVAGPGDVTHDGYDDVVLGNIDAQTLDLYVGTPVGLGGSPTKVIPLGGYPWVIAPGGDPFGNGRRHVLVEVTSENQSGVQLFEEGDDGLDVLPVWQVEASGGVTYLGGDLSVGDLDGDGLDDLVLGQESAYGAYPRGSKVQAAVYAGSLNGPGSESTWVRSATRSGAYHTGGASAGGDVNGDGYADLVVSDLADNCTSGPWGGVAVYNGSAAGPTFEPSFWLPNSGLGLSSRAGDLDGDGFDDVLVSTTCGGAQRYVDGARGSAVVALRGSAGGLGEPSWAVRDDLRYTDFARDFDAADVDGDGLLDLLVATSGYETLGEARRGYHQRGMGMIWLGSPTGFGDCASTRQDALHPWPNAYLRATGSEVSGAPYRHEGIRAIGDIDGDGREDVAVYQTTTFIFTDVGFRTACGAGGTEG